MEPNVPNTVSLDTPMDYENLIRTVGAFANRYPFLTVTELGKTILGRSIPLLIIGEGERNVLYVGAHHGMEWITTSLLLRYLNDFCEACSCSGIAYKLSLPLFLKEYRIHVIPMLNPDGVEYQIHGVAENNPLRDRVLAMNGGSEDFTSWQANARGVDLNHNYNAGFADYKRLEAEAGIACGAPTRYSGQSPESEPEVAALCNYIRFWKDLKLVLSLHTQGEEIFYRSGGKMILGTFPSIAKLSRLCGYRLSEADGMAAYGGLTDWCLQKCEIPALTIECGKGKNPLPITQLFSIYANLRKALFLAPTMF